MSRTEWNLYKAMDKADWLYDFLEEAGKNAEYQGYMKSQGYPYLYVHSTCISLDNGYCPTRLDLSAISHIRDLLLRLRDDIQLNIDFINEMEKCERQ